MLRDYKACLEINPDNEDAAQGAEELEEELGQVPAKPAKPAVSVPAPTPAEDTPPPRPAKVKRTASKAYESMNPSGIIPSAAKLVGEHGKINRQEAEARLTAAGTVPGMYLLRSKEKNQMVVSRVNDKGLFVHDLIVQTRAEGGGAAIAINGQSVKAKSMGDAIQVITRVLKGKGINSFALTA